MEDFFDNELIKKFEEMIENNDEFYFDTEEYEDIIIHYLEIGDIVFAETATNYALKMHPGSNELKIKQLEVLLELEQYSKVEEIIHEIESYSSQNTDFLVCCAKYYSNLGDSKKSIEYCLRALENKEEENFLHNFIADEYYNLNDPFNALKHYQSALRFDPQDDYSLENIMLCFKELNKNREAIEFLNDYIDQFPFSEAAWYEYGQFYFNKKNYKEAIVGFDYLLAINSQSINVYSNKAACYEALKDWDSAISVYEELLELEYTKAYTYYKIGLCYKELKLSIPALNSFHKSIKEDPQFYLSMMELSDLYHEMGNKNEAIHFVKEAIALNESNVDYHKKIAFLYIDNGNFEESLTHLDFLTKIEPSRFYNWYAYTEVLMLIGEYQKAIVILEDAIKMHNRAELYYQLSNCLLILKESTKAEKTIRKALELDPSISNDMQMKYPFIKDQVQELKQREKKS